MFRRERLVLSFLVSLVAVLPGVALSDTPAVDFKTLASRAYADTKVSATQPDGYKVLTTGTTGTVTPAYLTIPVTTAASGKPAANNAPTGSAAVWIE